MTVDGSGRVFSFEGNIQLTSYPSIKKTTPFSIDDILSESGDKNVNSSFTKRADKCYKVMTNMTARNIFFDKLSANVYLKNQENYIKWFERLQALYAVSSIQPFCYPLVNVQQHSVQHPALAEKAFSNDSKSKFPFLIDQRNFYCLQNRVVKNYQHKTSRPRRISTSGFSVKLQESLRAEEPQNVNFDHRPTRSGFEISPEYLKQPIDLSRNTSAIDSPLSALEKLTCVTFKEMEEKQTLLQAISTSREAKMKRRKCRTAFSAFQLAVLEQRFNCHKYLTPTDRDQIANQLDLSAPQVITWFQNRRAKQKRDLEEKENDIKTIKKWEEKKSSKSPSRSSFSDDEEMEVDVESC